MVVGAGEDFNTVISVERYSTVATPSPGGVGPAGIYLDINQSQPLHAGTQIVLEVGYLPLPAGVNQDDLKLYHYTGGAWVDITDSIDTVNKKIISVPITSFSIFGLFTEGNAEALPVYNKTKGLNYNHPGRRRRSNLALLPLSPFTNF